MLQIGIYMIKKTAENVVRFVVLMSLFSYSEKSATEVTLLLNYALAKHLRL